MKITELLNGIKISKEKREKALIGFLIGVFFLLIATPAASVSDTTKKKADTVEHKNTESTTSNAYIIELENKLEKTISGMEGAGEVKVMITLKNNGEKILEKNLNYESEVNTSTNEGKKEEKNVIKNNPETVLVESGGDTSPIVISETYPEIEGVFVVCEGGDNEEVVLHIKEAVMALFPIDVHKIVVCKYGKDKTIS